MRDQGNATRRPRQNAPAAAPASRATEDAIRQAYLSQIDIQQQQSGFAAAPKRAPAPAKKAAAKKAPAKKR
jgi:hypothetical protein